MAGDATMSLTAVLSQRVLSSLDCRAPWPASSGRWIKNPLLIYQSWSARDRGLEFPVFPAMPCRRKFNVW